MAGRRQALLQMLAVDDSTAARQRCSAWHPQWLATDMWLVSAMMASSRLRSFCFVLKLLPHVCSMFPLCTGGRNLPYLFSIP